jgi:CelD/BcsL family acetyltransferase involved in cellulose biosynthesis
LRVRILRGLSDLAEISSDWDRLAERTANPTMQHAWFRCLAETFRLDQRLRIAVVESSGGPVAIAPLVAASPALSWELLGLRYLGEPVDFLYADSEALDRLVGALLDAGVSLNLGRFPAESRAWAALRDAYQQRGLLLARAGPGCPRIALDQTWAEPESHFDADRRSDLRRAMRRALGMGEVAFQFVAPRPEELAPLLDEAYRIEAAGWKGRDRTALAHDALVGSFFRSFAAAACGAGTLRLEFLHIGGKPAAMQLAVEMEGASWLLKIGHDEAFARCSPGSLLIMESIRRAAKRGLRAYEFLGVEERWTRAWTPTVRPCASAWLHPISARALAALAIEVPRAAARRAVQLLRRRAS